MKQIWYILTPLFAFLLAACVGNPGEEMGDGGGNTDPNDNTLRLEVSSPYVTNDGKDQVVFTVKKGSKDVTEESTIYKGYEPMLAPVFSTTELGQHKFFARYGNETTETIIIEAISGLLEVPEDSHPDQYDGFRRRILGLQGTSLGCTWCPMMIAALDEFFKLPTANDFVLVAAHGAIGGDDMINDYSTRAINAAGFNGIPALSMNLRSSGEMLKPVSGDTPVRLCGKIKTKVEDHMKTSAKTAIAAAVRGDGNTIRIGAKVKVNTTGKYRISVWLVEDGISRPGQQENSYGSQLSQYNFDNHHCVLRYISSSNDITGEILGGRETTEANQTVDFFHELPKNNIKVENLSKTRAIIIVTHADSKRYTVDNVISCPMNQEVAFEYNK